MGIPHKIYTTVSFLGEKGTGKEGFYDKKTIGTNNHPEA